MYVYPRYLPDGTTGWETPCPCHDEREREESFPAHVRNGKQMSEYSPATSESRQPNDRAHATTTYWYLLFSFFNIEFHCSSPFSLFPPIECVEILKAELPITLVQWISDNPIIMRSVTDTICESFEYILWTSCIMKRSKEQRDGSENWVSSFVRLT
jgi:hypothetical protein